MISKSKTILIAHNYTTQSFACMSHDLANFLSTNGYKVVFISYRPYYKSPLAVNDNLTVYSWSSEKRPTGVADLFHFISIYLKHKPNIVIGHFVGENISIVTSKLLSFGKVKTFAYYHTLSSQNNIDGRVSTFRWIRKYFFYKYFCDKVLPTSQRALDDYDAFFMLNNGYAHLTPLRDRYNLSTETIKSNLENKNENRLKIGFIGRLDKSKGIEVLRDLINGCHNDDRFAFTIAEAGKSLVVINEIFNDYCRYLGEIPYIEIDKFIMDHDIIIVPSLQDNLVTVGIETMMNSRLLMISHHTGLSDYLTDGFDCIKLRDNYTDIREQLIDLIEDKRRITTISNNGRETYLKKFSPEKYHQVMFDILGLS